MPIIGMTDKKRILQGIPALGKLRKGSAKRQKVNKSTGKPVLDDYGKPVMIQGTDLDYFRFTSERQDVAEAFTGIYGDAPAIFRVYLPFATPEENFDSWREQWGGGRTLLLKCDGERLLREYKDGQYKNYGDKPREQRPTCQKSCEDCPAKPTGRLSVILPELFQQGFIGPVIMETHSVHDIVTIFHSLEEVYQKRQERGLDLRNMEFSLCRIKKTVSAPINGKRSEVTKNLVSITPSVNWARLQIAASQNVEEQEHKALLDGGVQSEPPESALTLYWKCLLYTDFLCKCGIFPEEKLETLKQYRNASDKRLAPVLKKCREAIALYLVADEIERFEADLFGSSEMQVWIETVQQRMTPAEPSVEVVDVESSEPVDEHATWLQEILDFNIPEYNEAAQSAYDSGDWGKLKGIYQDLCVAVKDKEPVTV